MRNVALVTAHFPPSNLVGVHRARVWSQLLPEFGWHPIVVTAHWKHYEETLDWDLLELVAPELDVIRTKALGTKPLRILGNMALRSMWWTWKALDELLTSQRVDFVHIVVPDHYSAILGPLLYRKHRMPYGIDYSDPWVHDSPRDKTFLSKAWVSCCLSYVLEPWAIRHARLITGVSDLYYSDVFVRNPRIQGKVVTAAVPLSNSECDFEAVSGDYAPRVRLFDPDDGKIHLVYAGALLPRADQVLDRFLAAIRGLAGVGKLTEDVHVTFIGTGRSPDDPEGFRVLPIARRHGVEHLITEYPRRIGYLDVLWHLKNASGIVILGSSEPHYTPSKVFQAIQSRKAILALLHPQSTATALLRESNAGIVADVPTDGAPNVEDIERSINCLLRRIDSPARVSWDAVRPFSARECTRRLADAMNEACEFQPQ